MSFVFAVNRVWRGWLTAQDEPHVIFVISAVHFDLMAARGKGTGVVGICCAVWNRKFGLLGLYFKDTLAEKNFREDSLCLKAAG